MGHRQSLCHVRSRTPSLISSAAARREVLWAGSRLGLCLLTTVSAPKTAGKLSATQVRREKSAVRALSLSLARSRLFFCYVKLRGCEFSTLGLPFLERPTTVRHPETKRLELLKPLGVRIRFSDEHLPGARSHPSTLQAIYPAGRLMPFKALGYCFSAMHARSARFSLCAASSHCQSPTSYRAHLRYATNNSE